MLWKLLTGIGVLMATLTACAASEPPAPKVDRPIGGPPIYAQVELRRPTRPPSAAPTAQPWPTGVSATPLPARPTATPGPTLTPPVVTPIAALPRQGQWLFVCGEARALCLAQADGSGWRQITMQGGYLTPHWSPDGSRFAAVRQTDMVAASRITGEIGLFAADGMRQATFALEPAMRFVTGALSWSPNRAWLAVTVAWDANQNRIADADEAHMVYVLDSASLRLYQAIKLSASPANSGPVWSPDSRYLALSLWRTPPTHVPAVEVSVYDMQTGELRTMAEGTDPTWRPGITDLTYVTGQGDIHSLNLESGVDRPLVTQAALHEFLADDDPWLPEAALALFWPTWSPDAQWLAFRVRGTSGDPNKPFPSMMFTIEASGKNLRRWPDTDLVNTARQVWSPDSRTLVYPYWLNGNGRYYPEPARARSDRRFAYNGASGVIAVDVGRGVVWDEGGVPPAVDQQSFASFSPDGQWLLTRAPYPEAGVLVRRVGQPSQRWLIPHIGPDSVQWQTGQ